MTSPSDRPPTLARELGERAVALELALENVAGEKLDRSLERAGATFARTFGTRALHTLQLLLRTAAWATVGVFFIFGGLFLALRYWLLPDIDHLRPRVEAIASEAVGLPVTVGRIEANWRGLNPALALTDVRVTARGGAALALPRVEGTLSWISVAAAAPRFRFLRIYAPQIEVALLPGGQFSVAGIVIDPQRRSDESTLLDWLLAQQEIGIWDARLRLRDERGATPREIEFADADLLLEGGFGRNRFSVQLAPPPDLAAPVDIRGDFRPPPFGRRSDFTRWRGELFAQVDYVDLATLNQWLRTSYDVRAANGALRAWMSVDAGEIVGVTADLALQDVDARLAPDLQPLKMSSLQGRVTQSRWGDTARGGQQLGLQRITFVLASGAQFPPLDLTYRSTRASGERPQTTEVEGSRLELASLAGIATHVPLGREIRETIARYAPRGELADFALRWDGPEPQWRTLAAKARFERLSLAAQPASGERAAVPGFERLSGSVQMERGGGQLRLAARNAELEFPGVFMNPRVPLAQLNADVKWRSAERLEAHIDSLQLGNEDMEISASGTWRAAPANGAGALDISGRIERLDARHAYRYVPLAAGVDTVRWLQAALIDGRLDNGSFRVRGDLARFPFADSADGEFRASARVRGMVLDVGPDLAATDRTPGRIWPLLRDVDGDLVFERQGMTLRAQRGSINNVRIAEANARIPDLGHDATLSVSGQASGALADMLGYVNASPVAGWIGDVTRGAEARGAARLDLKLDIPLLRGADTRVKGALQLQGNDLTLASVPPFTRVAGTLGFNERGIRMTGVTAGFIGGQSRLDASTRADGATVINGSGTTTPAGLRRAIDIDTVSRILDRAQGTARYSASVTAQRGSIAIVADSDLVDLALDGIAPLRKASGEAMPLRYEHTLRGEGSTLRVSLARAGGVHTEHRREGSNLRLERGVIAVGEAITLPDSGMQLLVNVPRLDVAAWSSWLGLVLEPRPARPGPAADDEFRIDRVALHTGELVIERRPFRNVTLGATRTAVGGYDANVVSDGVSGFIGWRPAPPGGSGIGQINARLTKLIIGAGRKDDVAGVLQAPTRQLPAFDVTIDNFEMGPTKYGRLELAASNTVTPAGSAWRLSRLEVSNADMKASASGDWLPAAAGVRRMRLDFALDTTDAGATLARFGVPNAVARGHGKLDGKLEWNGAPFEIDYATLAGTLGLRVDDGRFLKVDARGAGRLLTVLSLQSLSRTLTTDTREGFGEGFAFSTIKADATVARGIMSTENFSMTGTGAGAFISGSVDLRNETQNLHLVVLPELDASTAALALGVANPILGLGALLANLVLKAPLSKAFALEYDITGSWSDPIVTRRSRVAANPSTETVR